MGDFEVQNLQRSDQNRNVTHGISQVMKIIQIHPGLWKKNSRFVGSLPTKHFETYGGFFMGENCGRQEHCQSFVDGGGLWALCILLAEEAPRPLGWPRMASKKICFPIYQMSTDQFAKLGVVLSVVIGQLYTTSSKQKCVFAEAINRPRK